MPSGPSPVPCRAWQLGLLAFLTAGCAEGTPRSHADAGAVVQRDSAGITIVETPGEAARSPIGWTVDEAPGLQLGSSAGEGPEQFHSIGGVTGGIAELPDGRIVVVDGGSGELRFFDAEGGLLDRVGGLGDGPGEFRSPLLVPYASADSLLIFDTRHRRFTLLSSDGRTHRAFPLERLPTELLTGAAVGASDAGVLMRTALGAVVFPAPVGQQSNPVGFRWIDLASRSGEIVAQFQTLSYGTNDLGDFHHTVSVPFSGRPSAAVTPVGFLVASGVAPEVRRFDQAGRLTHIFRLAEDPRPLGQEDVDAVLDFRATRFSVPAEQARRVYEQMDLPDYWPSFQGIRVDPLGWTWVELYRPPQEPTASWMAFDPDGVARGTVAFPPDLEVHQIGADHVLGRWQDELRVEHVRRHRLDRHE